MTPSTESNVSETPESRKRKRNTCDHGRRKDPCKDCDSSSFCTHEGVKVYAKTAEEVLYAEELVYAHMEGVKVYAK